MVKTLWTLAEESFPTRTEAAENATQLLMVRNAQEEGDAAMARAIAHM